jgi:hypothetical protein
MMQKAITWFIIICSISAFHFRGLGKGDRILDIIGISSILVLLVLYLVYQGKVVLKENFKWEILFLMATVFISVIMAKEIHNQPLGLTLYQQRATYYFLFYFLLHYLMPDPKDLEKVILSLGIAFCFFYILQTLAYPTLITDAKVFTDRGTLRIFMPGSVFMTLGYFISFQRIFEKFSWVYLLMLVLTLIVAFLLAGRQLIFSLFVISIFNLFFNKQIKYRVVYILVFSLMLVVIVYLMRDTIYDMVTLTFQHSREGERYIRFRAANFFISGYSDNTIAYVFGNGTPTERSAYGIAMEKISTVYGYYLSDLGIIGVFFKFGILYVITVFVVFIKIYSLIKNRSITYLKNFIASVIITMFTTVLIFDEAEGIVVLCIIFYLIDYYSMLKGKKSQLQLV